MVVHDFLLALQHLLLGLLDLLRSGRRDEPVGAEQHHQHQHEPEQAELQVDEVELGEVAAVGSALLILPPMYVRPV